MQIEKIFYFTLNLRFRKIIATPSNSLMILSMIHLPRLFT